MSNPLVRGTRTDGSGNRKVTRYESTIDPTVNDDSYDDVEIGTVWAKLNSDKKQVAVFICTDPTAGAAVWKRIDQDGDAGTILVIEETVEFTADAAVDLATQIPAGGVPVAGLLNYDTAVVLSTAVKIGLGTTADPDGYALSGTGVTKNTKTTGRGALCGTMVATATTITLSACATGGTTAGSVTSGTVRARVIVQVWDNIPDA